MTTARTVSHTGVCGLTLGGGFGRLARKSGLVLGNVTGVDIVTATATVNRNYQGNYQRLVQVKSR